MRRLVRLPAWVSLLLLIAGCATPAESPPARDEPVAVHKPGSELRSAEHFVVDRQIGVVSASVSEFRNRCLKERGIAAKMGSTRSGMISLTVQGNDTGNAQSSASPDESYTLVAEMHPIGTRKTRVDIYHASRGKMAETLKEWMEGNSRSCPSW